MVRENYVSFISIVLCDVPKGLHRSRQTHTSPSAEHWRSSTRSALGVSKIAYLGYFKNGSLPGFHNCLLSSSIFPRMKTLDESSAIYS